MHENDGIQFVVVIVDVFQVKLFQFSSIQSRTARFDSIRFIISRKEKERRERKKIKMSAIATLESMADERT